MELNGITGNFLSANVEALAVVIFKGEKPTISLLKELDKLSGGQIGQAIKTREIKGDADEATLFRLAPKGKLKARRLLLLGGGDRSEYKSFHVARLAGVAARILRKSNTKNFAFLPRSEITPTFTLQFIMRRTSARC